MSENNKEIKLFGTAPGSIVDGPGIRFAVFVQGCSHHCKGCHNPESQAHGQGKPTSIDDLMQQFSDAKSCTGVTFSGGEPFEQASALANFAKELKKNRTNVWCYSGYLFEDLLAISKGQDAPGASEFCNKSHAAGVKALLENIDVLIDGPFIEAEKSYDALYRGSKNQRLIDVPKSLQAGSVVL